MNDGIPRENGKPPAWIAGSPVLSRSFGLADEAQKVLSTLIVGTDQVKTGDKLFNSLVTKVKGSGATAMFYGGYTAGAIPQWSWSFALDVAYHAVLPATAIILGSLGGWALGMRAMMVTTQGEDYVTFAEAKGLSDRTLFVEYGMRNAILPQATALALSLGQLVSGAVLVEIVFGYPGIGTLLFQGIRGSDFFLVQGIVFLVIVAIGLATLILDLTYPLLDPRIVHRNA